MMIKMIVATAVLFAGIEASVAQTPSSSPAQTATAPTDEIATLSRSGWRPPSGMMLKRSSA
jgi:hypothetical protein